MNNKNNFKKWKIPLYKIYTDDEDLNLITKIVKRGTQWAIGPEIEEFEMKWLETSDKLQALEKSIE